MSPARVIKNTNCQQNGGCCVESTEDPKWISPSNSSPSPSSSVRRSLPVIIRDVARIPLRVRVSRAQTRRNGPLSLIGPPCLLSPYRFCQYSTGILTVRAGGEGRRGELRKGGGTGRREGESRAVVEGCSTLSPCSIVRGIQIRRNTSEQNAGYICFSPMKMQSSDTFNIELRNNVHSKTISNS
ncbi:hypothetical protein QQF64_013292 [Cirrhinus molitorella]|uniref:Uncharacterized protein n=1 Tax=Cirrhinus molitorella TaxID=172907 RepID=A0ABR3LQR4_9TELE